LTFRRASVIGLLGALVIVAAEPGVASIAAGGLLHPARRNTMPAMPERCEEREFAGLGVSLSGWSCSSQKRTRGTIVYLHGIADNRGSSVGAIHRFTAQGFDVVAYDSRAHGRSGGEMCTYGYYEKDDLRRVLDTLPEGRIVLMGTSLGAAVAIQTAGLDQRVSGVIAAEVFSDLETVARGRAPFFLPRRTINKALELAESRGSFSVEDVSPLESARLVHVPVLLIHGADDSDTPPAHSEHVFEALGGPKRLILTPGAGHNRSLSDSTTWTEIDKWLSHYSPPPLN
jgi:uncharacterized protein